MFHNYLEKLKIPLDVCDYILQGIDCTYHGLEKFDRAELIACHDSLQAIDQQLDGMI